MGLEKPEHLKKKVEVEKRPKTTHNEPISRENAFFDQNLMKNPERQYYCRKIGPFIKKGTP